jgi:hypothetical protein
MPKMKKLALTPLLLLSLAAHADEREWHPYKKLVEDLRLDKFYALPAAERDKINLFLTVKPHNKNIKPCGADRGARQRAPATAGTVAGLPHGAGAQSEMDERRRQIMTSLPKEEKSAVGYDATTPLPDGLQWNYAPVMGSVEQMNQAIKKWPAR